MFPGSFLNPWREVNRLNRMLESFMQAPFPSALMESPFGEEVELIAGPAAWRPACDVDQTDTHYLVSFDLPGIARDDIKIEVKDQQLYVSGERASESKHTEGEAVSRERYAGSFMRSFTLPTAVKAEQVQANLTDGVLRIAIPKGEAAQKRSIPIQSGHAGFFEKLLPHKRQDEKREAKKEEKIA